MKSRGGKLDAVIEFQVDDKRLIERVKGRAEADRAAGKAVRPDDTPEVFPNRLAKYHRDTAPLIAYYRGKGLLKSIDGMEPVEQVSQRISAVLEAV